MHYCTLVLGPDPEAQLEKLAGDHGVDWFAIGGRYSGNLALRPGATSGRVYGDALPGAEAMFATMTQPADVEHGRGLHGTQHGPGVDQAVNGDVDWHRSPVRSPAILVDHGRWHEPPEEAQALGMGLSLVAFMAERGRDVTDELQHMFGVDTLEKLEAQLNDLLADHQAVVEERLAGGAPSMLVTIMDIHI
jgi:hypothetical protein